MFSAYLHLCFYDWFDWAIECMSRCACLSVFVLVIEQPMHSAVMDVGILYNPIGWKALLFHEGLYFKDCDYIIRLISSCVGVMECNVPLG